MKEAFRKLRNNAYVVFVSKTNFLLFDSTCACLPVQLQRNESVELYLQRILRSRKMENIISRIDRIATENPDRIAYDYLGRTNTYGELKEKSDALAAYLKASNLPEKAPLIRFLGSGILQMIANLFRHRTNPVGPIFRSTFIHLKIASKSLKKSQGLQPASH